MHLPPLKGIVAFEVVARLGSISKAAEELSLTASAVSHQIAGIESYVGRRLFERTSRGLMLTPVGERYQQDLAGALALMASAAQNARSAEGIEILRVHVSPSFASLWLMPRLSDFMHRHPDIRIQLSAAHTHSDFSRGEVDLDIRYGAAFWRDLHVETIFTEDVLPMMHPALRERFDVRSPEDLLSLPLIFSEINLVQWPRWFAANGVPLGPTSYPLKFDRAYLVIDAALQGMGIALDSSRLAERFLRSGELVPVFADRKAMQVHAHHLVYPSLHGRWNKVMRFVEWLRESAAADTPPESLATGLARPR
jgi:LysR family glycine cleavage system transcriptional activator